ncbi:hypothetical protein Dda_7370 [Drechslerella dactyloides]|uniref:Uncharacterized protein n=1 Tax=Drechslerella dactyloides TaxID=74499 RepID=A0AAD6IS36_DREDA|nr:hypothetical protein Dda_7370 [Drechslerella dactyloides]
MIIQRSAISQVVDDYLGICRLKSMGSGNLIKGKLIRRRVPGKWVLLTILQGKQARPGAGSRIYRRIYLQDPKIIALAAQALNRAQWGWRMS